MIKEFEYTYMNKYWNNQMFQWCNYFEEGKYDLSGVDNEIFKIVMRFNKIIKPIDRKSKVACLIMNRDLVDKSPKVAKLRNYIDNKSNFNYDVLPEVKKNRYNYKLEMALRMKNYVLNLIKIRNSSAKQLGFSSYPELVLTTEEIDKSKLIRLLNKYVDDNLPKALDLIKKYDITWESWFSDLNRISSIDNTYKNTNVINQLFEIFGLNDINSRIQIRYMEDSFSGVASEVSPGDIRIVVKPINSLFSLTTLFHEIGHAIAYNFNKEEGLYKILPASYDEAMAVVIENIASKLLLNEYEQKKVAEIGLLENTRCAISALFEFELWGNMSQAGELYIKHYSRLGFKINNPFIWASDTFRSIDPVYIHNYVVGSVLSEALINYFIKKYSYNYREWGKWLIDNIYIDGRKRAFKEKIESVCDLL
ncbi:hypothetical protein HBE96_07900 [Clostridium sp. P21]|uniref:Peptidase family M3 n=1 Tax=Clostridium muellerianum TaxID=2716538 RepID=A0A7Y0EFU3_9CLOT|nr:hypothetical protein [Clostridium muellerianum]NMM62616.1 hypothetical protein [Clostridium muellerianum]